MIPSLRSAVREGSAAATGVGETVATQLPWYWEWALRIQRWIDTAATQYLVTLGALLAFVFVGLVVFGVGRPLRERFDTDAIQAVQWAVVTVASVVFSAFLVAVWRLTGEVESALGAVAVGPEAAVRGLVTFIAFAAAYSVTRLTKRSVKRAVGRGAISEHQREVAHHLVQIAVFVPVAGFVVALWGIPVRSLFLGAGALGVVVGFAARQTLSGALSGFVILLARPFKVGDWVQIGDREGIVTDITLYNTQLRTFDEEHALVPNDRVTGNEVVNYTSTERLRVTTDVGVDYDCDVGRAAAIATRTMEDLDAVADTPEPDVVRHAFGDSAVVLRLRYWIEPASIQRKWRAQNAVIEGVKTAFEREGITIPFPQRAVSNRVGDTASKSSHIRGEEGEAANGGENVRSTDGGGPAGDESTDSGGVSDRNGATDGREPTDGDSAADDGVSR